MSAKIIKFALILFFGAALFIGIRSNKKKSYRSSVYNLSFQYSSDWTVREAGKSLSTEVPGKSNYLLILQSGTNPNLKFDVSINFDSKTCAAYTESYASETKFLLEKKSVNNHEWMIGRGIGGAMNETDSTFSACTVLIEPSRKFKNGPALLIITGFSTLDDEPETTSFTPQLNEAAINLVKTISFN